MGAVLSTTTNDAPIEVAVWSDILFFFRTFSCRKRERERYREEGEGKGKKERERVGKEESVWSRVCWEVVAKRFADIGERCGGVVSGGRSWRDPWTECG